jgi:hypothetical protein
MESQNNSELIQTQEPAEKAPYSAPVLVEYGDIHEVTHGASIGFTDGDTTSFAA